MAKRSKIQVYFVVGLGMLLTGNRAAGLSMRVSYHDLFELADVVVIATPIQRKVLDTGPGQFGMPYGIAISPDGSIYVSDINTNRIQKFAFPAVSVEKRHWGAVKALYR